MKIKLWLMIFGLMLLSVFIVQCGRTEKFVILSGSENKALEPLLEVFSRENGVRVEMQYKGSVDIMMELESGEQLTYDAVWPANSLWISIGDRKHQVKYLKSIMTTPVVFGVKKSLAQKLEFVGKPVAVKDLLAAIREKKLKFMMTSASQSNSGASAYLGFLYALLGNPETITVEDLQKPELKTEIRGLLGGINRSAGSSEWLKDLFLQGNYDAMVNYEALIIETNRELIKKSREPLYVIYPYDGLVIADSPLGYIHKGDTKKESLFKKLQAYLLSDKVQQEILSLGRRTGFGGMLTNADPQVFNPQWGIDAGKILSPIKLPSGTVILEALHLYQTEFKKPSYTVFCLDYSGSMGGTGENDLKRAMQLLLDQREARRYFLQSTSDEVMVVIPFSDHVFEKWQVEGNRQEELNSLIYKITSLKPGGGTDIYTPAIAALEHLQEVNLDNYVPAVVLMTDGQSNTGKNFQDLQQVWERIAKDIPIFSILFGEASENQLEQISTLTRGRLFDGKKDLVGAFKKVRGYN